MAGKKTAGFEKSLGVLLGNHAMAKRYFLHGAKLSHEKTMAPREHLLFPIDYLVLTMKGVSFSIIRN